VIATGGLIVDPTGQDEMLGVTVLPSGDLVAVGQSIDFRPRTWLRHGGNWKYVAPGDTGTARMSDVAAAGGKVVAVGWARDGGGGAQHPAVWTSTNGESWKVVPRGGDLQADGLSELTAVVAANGGGFLAVAVDKKADKTGDAALFKSADGTQWQRVQTSGLDGAGAQQINRITVGADGKYVAIGAALSGAVLGPAIWTSADGTQWQPALTRPPGSATLLSVARQPDGSLLVCGGVGSVDSPAAGCWRQRGGGDWVPLDVGPDSGSVPTLYIYGLAVTPDGNVAVGVGRDNAGTSDAAAWILRLPPA
jgi:hypothetical protein